MEVTGYELYTVPPRWVFLKLETDEGVSGWGEPVVEGRGETLCSAVSELVEDYVLGRDPTETGNCWSRMYRGDHYRNGPVLMSAIAGIDQALWDITGKTLGRPVYNLLGGPVRDRVRVYQWLSGERPADLAAAAEEAVEQGYTALGLMAFVRPSRVRTSEIVERVDARVGAVRDAVGDSIDLGIDFRGRVSTGVARQLLSRMEDYDLLFVEEPVAPEHDDALADLAATTNTSLATGQRLYSRWDFKHLVHDGSVDIVQPAISHAGGITEVVKIGSMAEAYDVMLMPKCSVGPIAFAAAMHVQMAVPNAVLQEQHDDFYADGDGQFFSYVTNEDLFDLSDGFMRIDDRPGLGVDVDEEFVEQQARKNVTWKGPTWHYQDGSVANW